MSTSTAPEVIVIGAGLGGLAAAVDLARGGAKVLVLERHNLPGGFATSFVRGRFEFEPSLHEMGASAALEFLQELDIGLEFHRVPEAYRLLLSDSGTDFRAPYGLEEFESAVIASLGGQERPVREFLRACAQTFDAFGYLSDHPRPSPKTLFRDYGDFLRTGGATTDDVADAVGLSTAARNLIYPYWCYLGVPTNKVSFSIWGSMIHSYLKYGAVIPKGRSHAITTALADAISDAGGSIRYNTEVVGLRTEGRRITGVRTADGDTIGCDRVVANVIPHRIFGRFVEGSSKIPRRERRLMNARRPGMSFFVAYLGLRGSPDELGFTDYSYFIAPHMDTAALIEKTHNRHDPEPMQASICLNRADPEASPPGTTILSITTGSQPEAWSDVTPWTYEREKRRFARLVIEQFERATGIALKNAVEEIETAAPPTFSRYVGSWNGTVYGYEPEPWDGIVPRALSENRERFYRNLRFCGGYAYRAYGYGSSLMSGRAAAAKTLEEMSV